MIEYLASCLIVEKTPVHAIRKYDAYCIIKDKKKRCSYPQHMGLQSKIRWDSMIMIMGSMTRGYINDD
jgi:hypothetical protein